MRPFIISVALIGALYFFGPPIGFPTGQMIEIKPGDPVSGVLRQNRIIRSRTLFLFVAKMAGIEWKLRAGRYVFERPLPLWSVLARMWKGEYGTVRKKITIPEGFSNKQIGGLIGTNLDETDQGRLFPDTYYFDQFATADEMLNIMKTTFANKVGEISEDTLVVASILEKEVRGEEDMQLVSGIIWKRLKAGMPLQVDAVPGTYEYKGLPPRPISNPGLAAISAARNPARSEYWYYLSGRGGSTHYARTHAEHVANKQKYLQ